MQEAGLVCYSTNTTWICYYTIIMTVDNISIHNTNSLHHQLLLGRPWPGPHGHVHVEMCSLHGQEIEVEPIRAVVDMRLKYML